MQEPYQVAKRFFNDNLENHFKKKEYSIIGTKTCYDSMGGGYKSYVFRVYDVPCLTVDKKLEGFYILLRDIIKDVDNIIDGLILAKQAEKPEGTGVECREAVVDWRSFPYVEIDHNVIQVAFRVSIHHK